MPSNLTEILSLVAKGRLSPAEAKTLIESTLGVKGGEPKSQTRASARGTGPSQASPPRAEPAGSAEPGEPAWPAGSPEPAGSAGSAGSVDSDSREGVLAAFDKLRKSVHVDELLKISSALVQQIAENMPERIERLQESVSHNINALGFSAGSSGVDAKLSVFRTFHVGSSARLEGNTVVGSQWFGVNFDEEAVVCENKFTAVQFSELAIVRSDFRRNILGLSRLSNVTIQESRFEANRLSRSTLSDVSFTESDFDSVRLLKSEFSQTILNASRIARCVFEGTGLEECEFDSCEFENVTFENCSFKECVFDGVHLSPEEPLRIVGRAVTGRTFRRIRDASAFLAALADEGASLDDGAGAGEEPDSAREGRASAGGSGAVAGGDSEMGEPKRRRSHRASGGRSRSAPEPR